MTDELADARYARFINKRFSELGAERFEKIMEESLDLEASRELEERKDKLTNAGKEEIVRIRWRAARFFNVSKGPIEISNARNSTNLPLGKETGVQMLRKS